MLWKIIQLPMQAYNRKETRALLVFKVIFKDRRIKSFMQNISRQQIQQLRLCDATQYCDCSSNRKSHLTKFDNTSSQESNDCPKEVEEYNKNLFTDIKISPILIEYFRDDLVRKIMLDATEKQNKLNKTSILRKEDERKKLLIAWDRFSQGCDAIDDVLEEVLLSKLNRIHFTKEDEKEIGAYLKRDIHTFLKFLFYFGFNFDPTNGICPLEYRSILEIILKEYRGFPIGDNEETLNDVFENIDFIDEVISCLNDAVDHHKKYVLYEVDSTGFNEKDLIRPDGIPETHTWWGER